MGSFRTPVINLKSKIRYLLCLAVIFSSLSTGLSIFLSQNVYAEDIIPACTDGHIENGDPASLFKVVLYCKNIATFANSTTAIADSVDLTHIILQPDSDAHNPLSAVINGDTLELEFYFENGSGNRDIKVDQNTIKNSISEFNPEILVTTDLIVDYRLPTATDKYYEINGPELIVDAASGVFKDATDDEGPLKGCVVASEPLNGTVTLDSDGSFTYTRNDGYYSDDQFSYFVIDGNDNSSNEAIVYINDAPPEIISTAFYKNDSGDSAKAKAGETLRVDVETSELVTITNMVIAGNSVVDYKKVDSTHYYFEYTMRETDTDGPVNYSFIIHDPSDKIAPMSSEYGLVTFNKTPPVIELNGDADTTISLHDTYREEATVMDDLEGDVVLNIIGSVNQDVVGDYVLKYDAVDSFGNNAIQKVRTVHVKDYTADEFDLYLQQLRESGFENNLDLVTFDNYENFNGLYIESLAGGLKAGRITFDGAINFSNPDVIDFLLNIDNYFVSDSVGIISLNMSALPDDFILKKIPATLRFYGLDKIGYSNLQNSNDVFLNLKVYDDDGQLVDKDGVVNSHGFYNNYVYEVNIKHFTKFVIDDYIAPIGDSMLNVIPAPLIISQTAPTIKINVVASNNEHELPRYSYARSDTVSDINVANDYTNNSGDGVNKSLLPIQNEEAEATESQSQKRKNIQDITWYWWFLSVIIIIGAVWWIISGRKK